MRANRAEFGVGRLCRVLGVSRSGYYAWSHRIRLWEPPQFNLSESGRAHFLEFFSERLRDTIVCYPSKPFTYVGVSVPPTVGPSKQGYRSCLLHMDVDALALHSPGWPQQLKRLWLEVGKIVRPFFAEIRQGGPPIKSWWWCGIPRPLGLAAMLGPPYTELWPAFVSRSHSLQGEFAYLESIESGQVLSIASPEAITQPAQDVLREAATGQELRGFLANMKTKYPEVWPFAGPFE